MNFSASSSTIPSIDNRHLRTPANTFQRTRSAQRALPIIPLESEPVRREPPPPYSVHQQHRTPRLRSPTNNSSTTSDSDNDNGRHSHLHLLGESFDYNIRMI